MSLRRTRSVAIAQGRFISFRPSTHQTCRSSCYGALRADPWRRPASVCTVAAIPSKKG